MLDWTRRMGGSGQTIRVPSVLLIISDLLGLLI